MCRYTIMCLYIFGPWCLEYYMQACTNVEFFVSKRDIFEPNDDGPDPSEPSNLSPETINENLKQTINENHSATRNAQIENKFYYAGASARWMVQETVPRIIEIIDIYMDKVSNSKFLLMKLRPRRAKFQSFADEKKSVRSMGKVLC
jgi:hypothetical protein